MRSYHLLVLNFLFCFDEIMKYITDLMKPVTRFKMTFLFTQLLGTTFSTHQPNRFRTPKRPISIGSIRSFNFNDSPYFTTWYHRNNLSFFHFAPPRPSLLRLLSSCTPKTRKLPVRTTPIVGWTDLTVYHQEFELVRIRSRSPNDCSV